MRSALSKHGATQQAAFVNELEQHILSKLNVSVGDNECTVEEEVKKAVDAAKAEEVPMEEDKETPSIASEDTTARDDRERNVLNPTKV